MRATRLWCFAARATTVGAASVRPYRRVRQAIDQGSRGLLVAAEVFKEFETEYQRATAAAHSSSAASAGPSASLEGPPGDVFKTSGFKPLTAFCGSPSEVEPLTILLLKVLCDLRRLEEMRFLFTQCVLELEGRPPSIELFNVYLLAVSMTDTFNEHEVENVAELMRVKGTRPDTVTKLSMFMLYLRLGKEAQVRAWWPVLRDEIGAIVAEDAVSQYPLLGLRLQHFFQTLVRLHYDTTVMQECFQLLKRVSPGRCTPALLVPYMVLAVANQAMPPAAVVEILETLEAARGTATETKEAAHPTAVSETSSATAPLSTADALQTTTPPPPPALSSEVTSFRLLAKCARWGDAASAEYVRAYLAKYRPHFAIVSSENAPMAALLYVEALVRSGRLVDALAVVEAEVPAPLNTPGDRPKLFLQNRRMTLLPSDPLTNLVHAIARDGGDGVDAILGELKSRLAGQEEDGERPMAAVTAASLDLVLGSCAELQDVARAEELLSAYKPVFGATPGAPTYAAVLRCYTGSEAVAAEAGVARVRGVLRAGGDLATAGVGATPDLLRAALEVALVARDTDAALFVTELHAETGAAVDMKQGSRLLREFSLLVDAERIRRALRAMRAAGSALDQASIAECARVLRRWGIDADDL